MFLDALASLDSKLSVSQSVIDVFRLAHLKSLGEKPDINFFTVAPYGEVISQMGFSKYDQNERFG